MTRRSILMWPTISPSLDKMLAVMNFLLHATSRGSTNAAPISFKNFPFEDDSLSLHSPLTTILKARRSGLQVSTRKVMKSLALYSTPSHGNGRHDAHLSFRMDTYVSVAMVERLSLVSRTSAPPPLETPVSIGRHRTR